MLSPNLPLNVQGLIQLLVFLTPKQLTLKRRLRRRGGCPMGSSLPSHGARVRTRHKDKTKKKKKKKNNGRLKVSTKKYRKKSI